MGNEKVVLFSDSSMNIGGQELQALQQMHSLHECGYQPILLCKPKSAIASRAKDEGLCFIEMPFRNAFHIPSLMRLLRLAKEKNPVAMFCHGSHDALISALVGMAQIFLGRKRIPVFRVKTFQHGYPLSFAYNYLFAGTLIPSYYLRSKFMANSAINIHKLHVLYPGINFSGLEDQDAVLPERVQIWLDTHRGPVISHGAILRGEKGHSTILKALVRVKEVFPNVRYVIAGEGQDKPLLEAEIMRLGLSDNVLMTGILKKIAPLLRVSDIAVLPSLIEPLGMFQIEAQYLEVPVIVSNTGGIPETMVNQVTGLMIESANVGEWANAIIWMLCNPIAAKHMAQEGKKLVIEKFSLNANSAGLVSLIERA
ncbi:Glycosyltransferase [Polynucleobacter duraquae]|uniref:Glycosyltransferase n=1 Tax=Polynucleobacter duraquae TaxID=1835254 RepID=A0A0E3V0H8_9BURK|nr:glycosyltransferase family 4 protein [Polynucleobacter duraquae]AKD24593.1 Glycosyltransferase [Polynucleobacter duraquae]